MALLRVRGRGRGRSTSFFPLLLLTFSTFQLSTTMATPEVFANPEEGSKLISATNTFALELYQQLGKEKTGENVVFSPVSVSLALAMTYLGAKNNTATQMAKVLKFENVDSKHLHTSFAALQNTLHETGGNYKLLTANRLYGEKRFNFLESFLEATRVHYGAELKSVDFMGNANVAREEINKWVEEKTAQKITNLLPAGSVDTLTRLVLINAIYFKGDWDRKFEKDRTRDGNFYRSDSTTVKIPMMNMNEKVMFGMIQDLKCKVLELPYVGDKISMVFFLPEERNGLAELEAKLTVEHLSTLNSTLRKLKVEVSLPRFKLETQFSLKETLQVLGLHDLFNEEIVDLTGIDGSGELVVSKVVHKAFINVDEEGSEAAAATGVVMMTRSLPRRIEFIADHPFLFMIQEKKTGAVLFLGRVTNPQGSSTERDEL